MGSEWRPVRDGGGTATMNRPATNDYSTSYYSPSPDRSYDPPQPAQNDPQPAAADTAPPRWYEPKDGPRPAKVVVSANDVRQLIASAVGTKLAEDFRLFLSDNTYYLPPVPDAAEIINSSGLSRATYMPETFDCDDFAMVMKAHFCEAAYKDYDRRAPHCVGMIWGELPHVHAINWMINDDYRFRFIEPQTGQIFEPTSEHRNITFMLG